MFVYRIIRTNPQPDIVIVEQSNTAYRCIRDAEDAALALLPSVPLSEVRPSWIKFGKSFRIDIPDHVIEIAEAIVAEDDGLTIRSI